MIATINRSVARYFSRTVIVLCFSFTFLNISVSAQNWPQWRGPDGAGISNETGLPTEWSDSKNIGWKTPIPGRGHSSPIVWGNKIFLTTSIEGPIVPGAEAVRHYRRGQEYLHPAASVQTTATR